MRWQTLQAVANKSNGGYMAKTDRLYIRIETELKEKLQQLADNENRTLSNYIESILINEVEKRTLR